MLTIYKVALALMVSLTLIYAFQSSYSEFMSFFSNALSPLLAGAAVVASGISLRKYWRKREELFSIIWLLFTIGLLFWFLGESIWMGYVLILNVEVPYPSIADAFWIIGYVPFFFAIYFYVKIFGSALSKKMLATSMGLTIIFASAASFTLITPVMGSEEDMLTLAVNFAYPLLDVALLSVSLLGLLIFMNGKLGKSWLLVNLGIFMDICGDIHFNYAIIQETYYNGHFLELFYHFGYIFFLLAFYIHTKEL